MPPTKYYEQAPVMAPVPPSSRTEIVRPVPHPDYPTPLLRLRFEDIAAPASRTFLKCLDPASVLSNANHTVLSILYPKVFTPAEEEARRRSTTPASSDQGNQTGNDVSNQAEALPPAPTASSITNLPPWPGTRSVTLAVEPATNGVAETSGMALDVDHKRIGFATSYIESLKSDEKHIGRELEGVIVHEMVHCWQWNGKGDCDGGLIEGIADWVRLKADLAPPHWKARHGKDDKWDEGYAVTAYFLDWLETAFGKGAVVRINAALREEYEEEKLFKRLFGMGVEDLWTEYCGGPGKWVEEAEEDVENGSPDAAKSAEAGPRKENEVDSRMPDDSRNGRGDRPQQQASGSKEDPGSVEG